MNARKLVTGVLLLAGSAAFFGFDLGDYFSLAYLQEQHYRIAGRYEQRPLEVLFAFLALYVTIASLSVPVTAVMTLAAGAIFGLFWGTVIVSLASAIGATVAMLTARYLFRDAIQKRWGLRLAEVNRGIEKEGIFYLFTLRLIPVLPFAVVNLLMGLTRIKVWTYAWVSQIGMTAGIVAYVNAGTQLAKIDSLRAVLSPALIGSFVLLCVLPFAVKETALFFRHRKAYARWKGDRPAVYERNLVVIGAGSGGLAAASIAATLKAKVTLVERGTMGGSCLNTGCVPTKALIRSARLAHQIRHGSMVGLANGENSFRFKDVMQRIQEVVRTISAHESDEHCASSGMEVLHGHATIINPWKVAIALKDGSVITRTTRNIVIATGARPLIPALPGLADVGYLTSDSLWDEFAKLDEPPRRLLILGGGPIGCELAQSFQRLGANVTLVERAADILNREDRDVSQVALQSLQADGVHVLTAHRAVRCEPPPTSSVTRPTSRTFGPGVMVVQCKGSESRIEFDALLCAVGRVPNLCGCGLEGLGILENGSLKTTDALQTVYPNIFAVGDVVGSYQFSHVAAHQAWHAAVNALFGGLRTFKVNYSAIPTATFTDPEIARVGLNEREARESGIAFDVTRFALAELDQAIADGDTRGLVKVLTVPGKDTILGVTIVGTHAGDLMAEYVLAVKHGLGLRKILGALHAYPTLAHGNRYAAGAWKRAHQRVRPLIWARRYLDWMRG